MCDPITAGAMALSGVGSIINGSEKNRTLSNQIAARNAATQAELQRQKAFQQRSALDYGNTANAFSPDAQAKALSTEQAAATEGVQANSPTAAISAAPITSNSNAPKVVQDAAKKTVSDIFARDASRNDALGTLKGWDQRMFGNELTLNTGARKLATTSDFARTSAGVNGLEQDTAYRNAYRPNSGIGDILQFAGNVGSFGGGKGWFNPAAGGKTVAFSPMTSAGAIY